MLAPRRLVVLREFVAQGTIAGAAEALAFTPSAVSQQLAQLQREAGVELFRKAGRRLELTDAGRMLAARAGERARRARGSSRPTSRAQAGEVRGVVRVAAFQTAARALVMPALERLAAAHPDAARGADRARGRGVAAAARPRRASTSRSPRSTSTRRARTCRSCTATTSSADELVLTLPRGHAAAGGGRRCALGSLRGEAWATARAGTNYADMFVRVCRIAGGFEPDIHHRVNDIRMLLDLVAISGAAALLPSLGRPGRGPARRGAAAGRGAVRARAVRGDAGGRSRAAVDGRGGRRAPGRAITASPCPRQRCSARRHSPQTRKEEPDMWPQSGGSVKEQRDAPRTKARLRWMRVLGTTLLVVAVLAAGPAASVAQLPPPAATRWARSSTSCRRCP